MLDNIAAIITLSSDVALVESIRANLICSCDNIVLTLLIRMDCCIEAQLRLTEYIIDGIQYRLNVV